jgi:hypothetical protein
MTAYEAAKLNAATTNTFEVAYLSKTRRWSVEWTRGDGVFPTFTADTEADAMTIAAGIAKPGDVLRCTTPDDETLSLADYEAVHAGGTLVEWKMFRSVPNPEMEVAA